MRTVIQRVRYAHVTIDHETRRSIGNGLLVLIGIEDEDNEEDIGWLSNKIPKLRIFDDTEGKMNLSVMEIDGEIMVVSQFTLHASTKKGNRPSWIKAAEPGRAAMLYERFVQALEDTSGRTIVTGEFAAHMEIELLNDGPVTIIMDTKNKE